jgi:hypothetical protein
VPKVPLSIVQPFIIISGFADVFQQIPLPVTGPPPSHVTLPPEIAAVYETSVTGVVVTIGGSGFFLQDTMQIEDNKSMKVAVFKELFI